MTATFVEIFETPFLIGVLAQILICVWQACRIFPPPQDSSRSLLATTAAASLLAALVITSIVCAARLELLTLDYPLGTWSLNDALLLIAAFMFGVGYVAYHLTYFEEEQPTQLSWCDTLTLTFLLYWYLASVHPFGLRQLFDPEILTALPENRVLLAGLGPLLLGAALLVAWPLLVFIRRTAALGGSTLDSRLAGQRVLDLTLIAVMLSGQPFDLFVAGRASGVSVEEHLLNGLLMMQGFAASLRFMCDMSVLRSQRRLRRLARRVSSVAQRDTQVSLPLLRLCAVLGFAIVHTLHPLTAFINICLFIIAVVAVSFDVRKGLESGVEGALRVRRTTMHDGVEIRRRHTRPDGAALSRS